MVSGHLLQGVEVLGVRDEVARGTTIPIRENGAEMKMAVVAAAARLAALSPQRVERTGQQRFTAFAGFEQFRQHLLDLEQFGAERTETLVHHKPPSICRSIDNLTYRSLGGFAIIRKKGKIGRSPDENGR